MSPIHLVLALDRHCIVGCAVSIRSVIDNARPGVALHFHIIASGIDSSAREALSRTVEEAAAEAGVSWHTFDASRVGHLLRSKRISHTAYAILFLGEILPPEVKRCIYLDCDLVVERDVVELWETELGDCTAAVIDNASWEDSELHQRRLGLRSASYFNSGVLLIDLERWRARKVGERALAAAERLGDRLILHDQDALNAALEDDWIHLPKHWNVWVIDPELQDDSEAVFHFMGTPKPWHADYEGRFAEKFFAYLDRTPFHGRRPWNPLGAGFMLARIRRRTPYLPAVTRTVRAMLAKPGREERAP